METKLLDIEFSSPALSQRYFFHRNYKRIVIRNRMARKLNLNLFENYEPLSFIAAVEDAWKKLSETGRKHLRAKILDALAPDRDFRELAHELRVYTHYRMNKCEVAFGDLEHEGKHDFNVTKDGTTFEVEAKTLSEDIGNLVSSERSLTFFHAFKNALASTPINESGILTLSLHAKPATEFLEDRISTLLSDFISRGTAIKDYHAEAATLAFERRTDWQAHIRSQNFAPIREAVYRHQENANPHAMLVLGRGHAILFSVIGNRPNRLIKGIMSRLKGACSQLSGNRPGLVWAHFLGLNEEAFTSLRNDCVRTESGAFAAFGRYVFDSPNRKHVCRLRLSGESDSVRRIESRIILPGNPEMLTVAGPAYDLISNISRFDPQLTL